MVTRDELVAKIKEINYIGPCRLLEGLWLFLCDWRILSRRVTLIDIILSYSGYSTVNRQKSRENCWEVSVVINARHDVSLTIVAAVEVVRSTPILDYSASRTELAGRLGVMLRQWGESRLPAGCLTEHLEGWRCRQLGFGKLQMEQVLEVMIRKSIWDTLSLRYVRRSFIAIGYINLKFREWYKPKI